MVRLEMLLEPGQSASAVDGAAAFWTWRTRAVQWRINLAWWLEAAQSAVLAGAVIATALVLIGRRADWKAEVLVALAAVLFIAVIAAATIFARRRFVSADSARAELESRLGLHARLSAAQAGVGTWPSPHEWQPGIWRWNWRKLAAIPALSTLLIVAAFWIPILGKQERRLPPSVKPPALAAVEEWLQNLEKNESIDLASLEPVQEQVDQLDKQDPAEWFSHANLEAADHLQAQMQQGMRTLDQSAASLQSLLGKGSELSDGQAQQWNEQLGNALNALNGNAPGLNRALANQLRDLDLSKLRTLTPEQLQKLQQQLKEASGSCKECLGNAGDIAKGDGDEEGEGEGGNGGISRGPGHPPLALNPDEADLGTKKTEALESEDLSRAALGDLAGTSDGQHQVNKDANHRSAQGGAVAGEGAGPEAVWLQQSLRPEERQRLRQFFK